MRFYATEISVRSIKLPKFGQRFCVKNVMADGTKMTWDTKQVAARLFILSCNSKTFDRTKKQDPRITSPRPLELPSMVIQYCVFLSPGFYLKVHLTYAQVIVSFAVKLRSLKDHLTKWWGK